MLIGIGLVIVCLGLLLFLLEKLNMPLGRLPGDAVWRRKNTTIYFPWVTCLILSIAGTFLLWLLNRRQ